MNFNHLIPYLILVFLEPLNTASCPKYPSPAYKSVILVQHFINNNQCCFALQLLLLVLQHTDYIKDTSLLDWYISIKFYCLLLRRALTYLQSPVPNYYRRHFQRRRRLFYHLHHSPVRNSSNDMIKKLHGKVP